MRARKALAVCACLAAIAGCKHTHHYDRSTPQKTLASFFDALRRGRIPADLDTFVNTPSELSLWRARCKSRGCSGGLFKVVDRKVGTFKAVLTVDYKVTGKHRMTVMHGKRAPITLVNQGSGWRIVQFGKRVSIPTGPPPAGPRDGGGAAGGPTGAGAGGE